MSNILWACYLIVYIIGSIFTRLLLAEGQGILLNLTEFSNFQKLVNEYSVAFNIIEILLPYIVFMLSFKIRSCFISNAVRWFDFIIRCLYYLHTLLWISVLIYFPIYQDRDSALLTEMVLSIIYFLCLLVLVLHIPHKNNNDSTFACLNNCCMKLFEKDRSEEKFSILIFLD